MRRVTDIALLLVQWALVLVGMLILITAVRNAVMFWGALGTPVIPAANTDKFNLAPGVLQGFAFGLIPLGLSAVLFYLRRLYLAQR